MLFSVVENCVNTFSGVVPMRSSRFPCARSLGRPALLTCGSITVKTLGEAAVARPKPGPEDARALLTNLEDARALLTNLTPVRACCSPLVPTLSCPTLPYLALSYTHLADTPTRARARLVGAELSSDSRRPLEAQLASCGGTLMATSDATSVPPAAARRDKNASGAMRRDVGRRWRIVLDDVRFHSTCSEFTC